MPGTEHGATAPLLPTQRRLRGNERRPGASFLMRNISPLDPIERRILQGVAKLWTSDEAAWLASCSVTLIRKAVRDGQLEGLRRVYYRNDGAGQILRRVRLLIPDWALRNWMASNFLRPTADGTRWKKRQGRKPGARDPDTAAGET
jgi:hypothetical protein